VERFGKVKKAEKGKKSCEAPNYLVLQAFSVKVASKSYGVVNQRVCRRWNMSAEDDAQQSAPPVSGEKPPAEPVCLTTVIHHTK